MEELVSAYPELTRGLDERDPPPPRDRPARRMAELVCEGHGPGALVLQPGYGGQERARSSGGQAV
jgi:hypothetical protein